MDQPTVEQSKKAPLPPKPVIVPTGVASPVESVKSSLETIQNIFSGEGTINPISKEDIAKKLGKKTATLILTFSTWGQYGIVNNVRGTGYLPSSLYNKYTEKTYDYHEREALLQMFKNPPLYAKLIENLNGQQLPNEDKFQNILKDEPYNVSPNAAERAAKVFYENLRDLKLIDNNNRFRFSQDIASDGAKKEDTKLPPGGKTKDFDSDELAKYEFPLTGNKKAILQYPKTDMSLDDFDIVSMAITLLAKTKKHDLEITLKQKGAGGSSN